MRNPKPQRTGLNMGIFVALDRIEFRVPAGSRSGEVRERGKAGGSPRPPRGGGATPPHCPMASLLAGPGEPAQGNEVVIEGGTMVPSPPSPRSPPSPAGWRVGSPRPASLLLPRPGDEVIAPLRGTRSRCPARSVPAPLPLRPSPPVRSGDPGLPAAP